tara:strand:+ start:65 stop:1030 length:966 start_codon:yes stop_codon:yes gene_type:complete
MAEIIAGGAGFIGINLVKRLLIKDSIIYILDNLSNSHEKELLKLTQNSNIHFINCDVSSFKDTKKIFEEIIKVNDISTIWHLAANSDIQLGIKDPNIDFKNTFQTTYSLIEISKIYNIKNFIFASSSAIYGNHNDLSINENTGPLMPISNYGAMKLASEAICFAACEINIKNLRVFRFPNVVGLPPTHGVLYDFHKKLQNNKTLLNVLGDGTQKKSYLHVDDLVDGMIFLNEISLKKKDNPIFNLGSHEDTVEVRWIAEEIVKKYSPNANIKYGKLNKGWIGDIPKFKYDTTKAKEYGWTPKMNSKEALSKAIDQIINLNK